MDTQMTAVHTWMEVACLEDSELTKGTSKSVDMEGPIG